MEKKVEAYIIGTIRTNNFHDEKLFEKISTLWKKAHSLHLEQATFYGIYHNYESDYKGNYDLTVATDSPLSGHEKMILPSTNYKRFVVDTNRANGVVETWQQIWATNLDRTYDVDFEVYHPDGNIEIYIAVE